MTLPLRQLEGKYEILHKIREGGMGAIYKVRHRLLDELRVIKVIRPQLAADAGLQERFLREAKTAIRLRHPNIAQLYDFAVDDEEGTSYIVMEYIDGVTFEELLRKSGPPGLPLALRIAEQGLSALGYLHQRGYIHRDISPDNLMLTRAFDQSPLVKLIDLGIVKRLGAHDGLTQTGMFMGKLRYASPEQLSPEDAEPDARSDVYSYGILFYELVTGQCPIAGMSLQELVTSHLVRGPIGFDQTDPGGRVPKALRRLILAMLARQADDRPGSVAEVLSALAAIQAEVGGGGELKQDLDRTLHRATLLIDQGKEYPGAGSTQGRLDAQFAPVTTPPPDPELRAVPRSADAEGRQVAQLLANAQLLARLDQRDKAVQELGKLLRLAPWHAEAVELLDAMRGSAAEPAGRRRTAASKRDGTRAAERERKEQREREQAKRKERDREVEGYLEAARKQLAQWALEGARGSLRMARERAPDDRRIAELESRLAAAERQRRARALIEQARDTLAGGDLELAEQQVAEALELAPEDAAAVALAAEIDAARERRRQEQEVERLTEAVERHLAAGDAERAESALSRAREELGELPVLASLEKRVAAALREAAAVQLVEEADRRRGAEDLDGALEKLAAALELAPEHPQALELRTEVEAAIEAAKAEAAAAAAAEEEARRERERVQAVSEAVEEGDRLTAAGELVAAESLLRAAARRHGESPAVAAALERVALKRRRLEEARRSIGAALDGGDLRRAERELDFADRHYGGDPGIGSLRRRLVELREERPAPEVWTGPLRQPEKRSPARSALEVAAEWGATVIPSAAPAAPPAPPAGPPADEPAGDPDAEHAAPPAARPVELYVEPAADERPLPLWSRHRRLLAAGIAALIALIAVIALIALAALVIGRSGAPETEPGTAAEEASAALATGVLVLDARPWAELERLVGGDGRSHDPGPDAITPLRLDLPPGSYVVTLTHPHRPAPVEIEVEVLAGRTVRRTVDLLEIDPVKYFNNSGL